MFCFFLFRLRFLFFGADVDAPGSSESPAGVSEGGKARFLPVTFREGGFSRAGSVVRVTDEGLVEESVPAVLAFVYIVVVVAEAVPVSGSLPSFDFFLFFLVVTACPTVMVNRVLGHKKERDV